MQPLPDLGARDLRCRRVFHQVEDRHGALAGQPVGQILQPHADVVAQASLGDLARGARHVKQLGSGHLDLFAQLSELVRRVTEHAVEDLTAHRDQVRMGHPGAVEPVA